MEIYKYNLNDFTDLQIENFKSYVDKDSLYISPSTAVAHRFVKLLLSNKTGISDKDIIFARNSYGKPFFNCKYKFSITHTGTLVFIAISDADIGIDAEIIRELNPKIKDKIVCDDETVNSNMDLLTLWTIKEAYYKYIGTGVTNPKSISINEIKKKYKVDTKITNDYILTTLEKNSGSF